MLDGCDSEDFIFDSIGTAESLLGVFPVKTLGPQQANSMFAFGPYPYSDALYWMGGISASGGSIDWLRKIMGDPALSYDQLDQLITDQTERPGQIRFFPYLAGSGSPNSNPEIRGVIWGLDAKHRRNDLYLAILEGIAFEAELIREHAQGKLGIEGNKIYIAGGGIKNQRWMQIKADIFGCPVLVIEQAETTLLGAALYAGLGAGVFQDRQDLSKRLNKKVVQYYYPSPSHADKYRTIFEIEYKGLHADMMRRIEKTAHSHFEE
jgi:xylulokinase